ncbi:hypothetical protein [Pararhodobacter sp.]|uniref:hypothetical protein n=1 Tax=Pararhodobacter sp. TaxID=2127056 RepID=UPI002AFF6E81|nr:hypothetical protein [Pararhodobacter sp.]
MFASYLIFRLVRPLARLAVIGLLLLAAMPANAEYMGGGAIYAPYNCSWPVQTEMTRARYVPGEDTDGRSHVTLNFAVGGVNIYTIRQNLEEARTWRRGFGRSVWGALYGMGAAPTVQVLTRSDAIYNGGDNLEYISRMRLRLRIRNFNGERGCSVSVALMMERWN